MENNNIEKIKLLFTAFTKKVKEIDVNNEIFMPIINVNENEIKIEFPVFNKLSGKLSNWFVYKFDNFVILTEKDSLVYENILEDSTILDLNNEKYVEVLKDLVEIFVYSKKLLKIDLNGNPDLYSETLSECNRIVDSYYNKIKEFVDVSFHNIYFDEIESVEETENIEETEIVENVENIEEVIEKNKIDVSELLLSLAKEIEFKEEINFDWPQKDGLRFMNDESLELAYYIIKRNTIKFKVDGDKLVIVNDMIKVCDNTETTTSLLEKFKDFENGKVTRNESEFTTEVSLTVNRMCKECKFQRCPKHMAAYVYYLMYKGLLEDKLEDRKKFREENIISDNYAYVWQYGDILRKIPDDVYEYSKELVNRNTVSLSRLLRKDKIEIDTKYGCMEHKIAGGNIENVKEPDGIKTLARFPDKAIGLCDTYDCSLRGCPTAIAGIIKYLVDAGRTDILESERKYYHDNQEEMDKQLDEIINERVSKISEWKEKLEDKFKDYREVINNYDDLIYALSTTQNNLHCTVEGEDEVAKNRLISNMVDFLYEKDLIENKYYKKISLQNLASNNLYYYYGWKMKPGTEEILKDPNGVSYNLRGESRFTTLERDKVYVINKISEFLNDYELYKSQRSSEYLEVRNKQFNYVLKLLTEMSSRVYIILDGTKEEIDELFNLEPKFQFIYSKYRFSLPEISLDDIFELYKKGLSGNLVAEISKDEVNYKAKCLEYISMNKNFIPFTNRELASYLAMYSNSNEAIVFPENIYKKESVDEALANIVGLESVKNKVKEFEKYMMFKVRAEVLGLKLYQSNMHMIFTGNPGVGKTTIARIMAKMLFDLGVIKENKLVEVERKDLIAEYIGQTAPKTAEVIKNAMGGVLFIDEAYSLTPTSERDFGGEAIATLIKAMEDHKDEFVVIFAGYKDEMKGFIDSNPGIASRIGYTFDFPDYNVDELYQIFDKKISKMGFKYSDKCELKIKKLCSYFSARKAFGNGRFVDKLIQEILMKHAINNHDDITTIEEEDVPTIKEFNNSSDTEESTDELLENVVGLSKLKVKIKEFEQYVKFIKEAEKKNIKLPNQNMHMIFTGNPGVGKTTIARIMAKILYNAGVLQENKLIEVERKDLIAGYIGQTAPKTSEVIEKAIGGVLFIDEAYSLTASSLSNDFGGEAIATLIKAMEDRKGEFIVIFAGYKKEMGEFIEANSGIASRIGYTFDFEDYSREELCEILYKKAEKSNLVILEEAKEKVFELMNFFHRVENIGNGRFVDRVFQEVLIKHSKNLNVNIEEITKEDIPTIDEMSSCLFNGNSMINPDVISDEAVRETAIHEVGHAFVRYKLFDNPGIVQITIKPEGTGVLGFVSYKIDKDGYVRKKSTIKNDIKVALAGMIAEEVFVGEHASGNTSDLRNATENARDMVTRFGMSRLGLGQIDIKGGAMELRIQEEINYILQECYDDTKKLIEDNKAAMENAVNYLQKNREITEEQFIKEITKENKSKKS